MSDDDLSNASIEELIERSSLGTPEAKALRDRTPPEVAKAIVLASGYLTRAERAEAERDRLRAVVEAAAAEASALAGGPHVERAAALASHLRVALGQRGATLSDDRLSQTAAHLHTENEHLAAENGRLRAVVEAARYFSDRLGDDPQERLGPGEYGAWSHVSEALAALDRSGDMGGGPADPIPPGMTTLGTMGPVGGAAPEADDA